MKEMETEKREEGDRDRKNARLIDREKEDEREKEREGEIKKKAEGQKE